MPFDWVLITTSECTSHLMRHRRFPWCSRSSHRSSPLPSRSGRTHHRIAIGTRLATKAFGRLRRDSRACTHGSSLFDGLDVWVRQGHDCAQEGNGNGGQGETHFGWSSRWLMYDRMRLDMFADVSGVRIYQELQREESSLLYFSPHSK